MFVEWTIPVLAAVVLHEVAHGLAARRLGGDLALPGGRLPSNPLRHVDIFGTILLPALLIIAGLRLPFGYAKAIGIDFSRFARSRRDLVAVLAAGPAANLALAIIAALALHAVGGLPDHVNGLAPVHDYRPDGWEVVVADNLMNMVRISLLLAAINIVPLPPLDGGRLAVELLPARYSALLARLERYGLMIVVVVFFVLPLFGSQLGLGIDPYD
jgi:Zn-dependent protease